MSAHAPAQLPRPEGLPPVPLRALAMAIGAGVSIAGPDPVSPEVMATGITLRADSVRPGDLFAALPGSKTHGARFVSEAAAAGAIGVVTDPAGYAVVVEQSAAYLPVMIVETPRAAVGPLAAQIYGHPSRHLKVIGVTGTSGKTTTCYLIESALAAVGETPGLIGTVETRIDRQPLPSALTTPEAPDLQALFAAMRQRGVTTVAMEVSSHALVQGRVDGTSFAAAAFTNLSQDHLDFHGDMEHYFAAKRLLFDGRARAEVVVIDDDYGRRLAAQRPAAVTVSAAAAQQADWTGSTLSQLRGAQRICVQGPGGVAIDAQLDMPGPFNLANATTALACIAALGGDPAAAAVGFAGVQVPGRMQRVDAGQAFLAFVDYAHKPAALAAALEVVRAECSGRVVVVLGAGGDRDAAKRPQMGAVAARQADLVIVTDDNPRSEDPAAIRCQVAAGAGAVENVRIIADRRDAIVAAVAEAGPDDAVLVAGKGHEQGQTIKGATRPFSDVSVLTGAIGALQSGRGMRT